MVEYKVNPVEHLGLVKSIALRYVRRNPSLALDELISAGYEGLLKGCILFDASKGVQPSTYLYKMVHGYIRNFHQSVKRHKAVSIDAPLSTDRSDFGGILSEKIITIETMLAAPPQDDNHLSLKFEELLKVFRPRLTKQQLDIFERRIMKSPPDTLQALGDTWGCSRESIRQNESLMLKKLRKLAEEMQINDPT